MGACCGSLMLGLDKCLEYVLLCRWIPFRVGWYLPGAIMNMSVGLFYAWLELRGRRQEYDAEEHKKLVKTIKTDAIDELRYIGESMMKVSQDRTTLTRAQYDEIKLRPGQLCSSERIWGLIPNGSDTAAPIEDVLRVLPLERWFVHIDFLSKHDRGEEYVLSESNKISKHDFIERLFVMAFGSGYLETSLKFDLLERLTEDGLQPHEAALFVWNKFPEASSGEVSLASFVTTLLELTTPIIVPVTIRASRLIGSECAVEASFLSGDTFHATMLGSASVTDVNVLIRNARDLKGNVIIRLLSPDGTVIKPECLFQDIVEG